MSLQKIKANCKGPDERGHYRVSLPSEDISIEEMREYGAAKLPDLSTSREKSEKESKRKVLGHPIIVIPVSLC